jgi:ferredoxin-type protein NapG
MANTDRPFPLKLSRNDFLKISGAIAGGGALFLFTQQQAFAAGVRPPGALPSGEFEAACLHCSRCVQICDQQALDLDLEGLPRLTGLNGYCDFCNKCIEVCPTSALSPVSFSPTVLGTAEIDTNQCIAWNWPGCRLCFERCEDLFQAITLDEEWRPIVNADMCVGCGACVTVCPQTAVPGRSRKHGKAVRLIPLS